MAGGNIKKRLGVFCFYDPEGIADRSVTALLDGMAEVLDDLVIVCNGKLSEDGRRKLSKYSDEIYIRDNTGLDAAAFQFAVSVLGKDRLGGYDEAVFFNDTVFGPMYPLRDMFDHMSSKEKLDFWGISTHGAYDERDPETGRIRHYQEHIQSYFIVYRSSVLRSEHFYRFWAELPVFTVYKQCVHGYETRLTPYFASLGFKWGTYLDFSDYGLSLYILKDDPVRCLRDMKCPVIKKKTFIRIERDLLADTMGEQAVETIRYIKEKGLYDTGMIFENIIRRNNAYRLYTSLAMNYVIPSCETIKINNGKRLRTALFAHLYYEDILEGSLKYILNVPPDTDIYISTPVHSLFDEIRRRTENDPHTVKVCMSENRGRDVACLLVNFKEAVQSYDLCCFYHDKKSPQTRPGVTGKSFSYLTSESVLSSRAYVENLIALFEKEEKIGLASPVLPIFGQYRSKLTDEWGPDHQNVLDLAEKIGLDTSLVSKEEPPLAPYGHCFWFRPDAIKPLFDYGWEYEDFPEEPMPASGTISHAIERIYPFTAQSRGYFSVTVMPDHIAAFEMNLLRLYAKDNNSDIRAYIDLVESYENELNGIKSSTAWKVGRFLTFIPRKMKDLFRGTEQRN